MSNKPTHEKEVEQLAEQVLETYGATKREEYNWIIATMVEMYKAGQQSKFTIQDFEKGLMLAGLVEPANEQEAKEKEALGKYVEAKKIIHKEYDRICPETNKQCQTGWCLPDGACSIQEVAKHGPIETIKTNNMQFKGFTQEHPSTPQGVEVLAEQIEEKGLTVTFGLQPEHLKVIEEKTSVWEGAVYSYQIWKDIGKVIAWEPLTAALYYFRYLRDQAVPPSSNQQNLIHPSQSTQREEEENYVTGDSNESSSVASHSSAVGNSFEQVPHHFMKWANGEPVLVPKDKEWFTKEEAEAKAEGVLYDMMKENSPKMLQFFLSCLAKEMHKANATDMELSCNLDIEKQRHRIVSKCELTMLNSVQNPETSVATDGASNSEAGNQIPSLPYPTGIIGWVKASERLPELQGQGNKVIIRCVHPYHEFVAKGFRTYSNNPTLYIEYGHLSFVTVKGDGDFHSSVPVDYIEWLDESPIPLHKEEELERLRSWKRQAIEVMPDMQKIGRLLGIKLGTSVSEQLIPAIEALVKENQELKLKQQ